MTMKTAIVSVAALALPALATAQTKISGTVVCAKPDQEFSIPVEAGPGQAYSISHMKCTWTKPMEIAGSKTKEDVFTNFEEIKGDEARGHGTGVGTLASGDQFHVRTEGKTLLKEKAPLSSQGTWKFQGGTGAIKTIKGNGTYTCKNTPEGMACDVTGDYSLPK
jgi:hypothetical protein